MTAERQQSQCQRILSCLESVGQWSRDGWVGLPHILGLGIASHTRGIHELRKAGHIIEKREQYVGHQRRVWYRLCVKD
jgi:hypothetical protein